MSKVLIAYVTKTNTTKHAGEIIRDYFVKQGIETDMMLISQVNQVESYDAIIVGAPINGMNWHPDAKEFVAKFKDQLKDKKVAYYLMSYILMCGRKLWRNVINKSLDFAVKMKAPVSIGKFGGAVDKAFPTVPRIMFGIKKGTATDLQNDENVKKWAIEVFDKFNLK